MELALRGLGVNELERVGGEGFVLCINAELGFSVLNIFPKYGIFVLKYKMEFSHPLETFGHGLILPHRFCRFWWSFPPLLVLFTQGFIFVLQIVQNRVNSLCYYLLRGRI